MPLKAVLAANALVTVIISGPLGTQGNTSGEYTSNNNYNIRTIGYTK